jgi:hypothetical protein
MAESIAKRTNSMANHRDAEAMRKLLTTALADLTALRASFLLLTAKLDLDAGVTDANYAALTNPAALTTTA